MISNEEIDEIPLHSPIIPKWRKQMKLANEYRSMLEEKRLARTMLKYVEALEAVYIDIVELEYGNIDSLKDFATKVRIKIEVFLEGA